ncbi:MAG TPA: hypothetical protein VFV50_03635 [Bdellovibrionales bacterium]|nr:hypothetical protein [Bdellovibrionales bacterium]
MAYNDQQARNILTPAQGWGSDADPRSRPGVPRDKRPELGPETLYPNIQPQLSTYKVHISTEHGKLPPVFGTSAPPSGLSGMMRDFAYKFSEGRFAHWLTLLAADRVNVLEGIISDLRSGHIPNIPKEMGIGAELKYNKKAFLLKVAGIAATLIAAQRIYSHFKEPRERLT